MKSAPRLSFLLLVMALSACGPLRGFGPEFPVAPKIGDVFQGDAMPWVYDGQRWTPVWNGYLGVGGCVTKYQGGKVLWKRCGHEPRKPKRRAPPPKVPAASL